MIAYLSGKIKYIGEQSLILLTDTGVGYEIFLDQNLLALSKIGLTKDFFIYQYQTESQDTLYGFSDMSEKEIFLACIKISGVGGKAALQLLSLGRNNLLRAFIDEDLAVITGVKGIGKKTAEKILIEMRSSKIIEQIASQIFEKAENIQMNKRDLNIEKSIFQTLEAMGYMRDDIKSALETAPQEYQDASTLIPYIISSLSNS